MSSIPPVPPSIAAAAGAIGGRDAQADASNKAASAAGPSNAIEAGSESGDRDADGRDLRDHQRKPAEEILEEAEEQARGSEERGGLDVTV